MVWVNEHSHIYHFAGTRDYGHTKLGAYMCEANAQAAGKKAVCYAGQCAAQPGRRLAAVAFRLAVYRRACGP